MKPNPITMIVAAVAGACAPWCPGQDLYDPSVLRTFALQFNDANWLTRLRQNYTTETDIFADLTVDGVTYSNVGVRIRGNTSYTALPAGSEKFSLKISMDAMVVGQELMSYDTINLNNGFHDPTFCREVAYNNYVAQFIPNPRANHVLLTLNGQNWGVYINVQQPDKRMLRDWFENADGLRVRCPNNPNGPGLRYNGSTSSGYSTGYEIQYTGGFADPWAPHIAVCNALTNGALPNWQNTIDPIFAIDPSIWSVVMENMLTDDDSYVNKGADFMTYRDPLDGRTHLLQRDANETFTQSAWTINRNFTAVNKPFLSRVLTVGELRQRYMAHYRVARSDMTWAYFGPRFTALRTLIEPHVQSDPKRLYSFAFFQQNFTTSVTLPFVGPAGGTVPGLQQFVNDRAALLNGQAELVATGPAIGAVLASDASPDPQDTVYITAQVASSGTGISRVELFYRPSRANVYRRATMLDNGLSGDGAAGDGVFGARLPIIASPGQHVDYYIAATASNAFASVTFSPARTELAPLAIDYAVSATPGMRITEWMYTGSNGEFIEFTNLSGAPVNMNNWSFDDDHAVPGAFSLSDFGVVQPAESVILTDVPADAFRIAWGLPDSTKIIGSLGSLSGNNIGRIDQINLFDSTSTLIDRLTYGDQASPGTIRTQNASGQSCVESIGQNDVSMWTLSTVGDVYGSWASAASDVGTPGAFVARSCFCTSPSILSDPVSATVCPASSPTLVIASAGTDPVAFQWQIEAPPGSGNFEMISDGPIDGFGVAAGAQTSALTLTDLALSGFASFRCIAANDCGSATSLPATLTLCPSDWNCTDGADSQDYFDFLDAFFGGAADFNRIDGTDSQDYFDFLNAFFSGCS